LPEYPGSFEDLAWSEETGLVGISGFNLNSDTLLIRYSSDLKLQEKIRLNGTPLHLIDMGESFMVLTITGGGILRLTPYTPSIDTDGDTIPNSQDHFPEDPAASIDSDRDGYPDSWNSNYQHSDKHWWMMIDPHPNDAVRPANPHRKDFDCDFQCASDLFLLGDPNVIDTPNTMTQLVGNRVLKFWDKPSEKYLGSVVIRYPNTHGLSDKAYSSYFYSNSQNRLYFQYGATITYISLDDPNFNEVYLATTPVWSHIFTITDEYLITKSGQNFYLVDHAGNVSKSQLTYEPKYHITFHAWSEKHKRIYYLDQDSGELTYWQFSPTGEYLNKHSLGRFIHRFVLSSDESTLMDVLSGSYYDVNNLALLGSHELRGFKPRRRVVISDNKLVITGTSADGQLELREFDQDFNLLKVDKNFEGDIVDFFNDR